jgi:hypothetical protein
VTGLLRAEFIKLVKRKLYWVMLGIFAFVMGMVAVLLVVLPPLAPEAFEGFPGITKPDAYLFGATQAIGQTWFPVILAVVLLAGETTGTIWATSLTMESRRWMHLAAKTVVATLAAWVATLAAIGGWSLVTLLFAAGDGAPAAGEWWAVVWKTGLIEFAWVSLGLGAAAILRSIGPAIGLGLAFAFGEGILAIWRPWQRVSLSGASSAFIADLSDITGGFGIGFIGSMSVGEAAAVIFGWALVGVALAWVGLQVRDA